MALNRPSAAAEALRCASALVTGLSHGRRHGCVLVTPSAGSLSTDGHRVHMSWPPPAVVHQHPDALAVCLALQASPTKEVVTGVEWAPLSARDVIGLQVAEGEAALGWLIDTWPGLSQAARTLLPGLHPQVWEGVDSTELRERSRAWGNAGSVPDALGGLALRIAGHGGSGGRLSRRLGDLLERVGEAVGEGIEISGQSEDPAEQARNVLIFAGNEDRLVDDASGGVPYPEWDAGTQRYKSHHTRVFTTKVTGPLAAQDELAALGGWFEAPLSRRWQGRLADGSDLDFDAVVDDLVDARTGQERSDLLYRQRTRTMRDVACAVLIDASGSLAQSSQLRHQIACADSLSSGMARAGERHAVFAFWSNTRHHVSLMKLRDFGDVGPSTTAGAITPNFHTRLGAALRAVTTRLDEQRNERKVLIVLTDGYPYDEGYEDAYACADVAKAVEEAESAGVVVAVLMLPDPLGSTRPAPLTAWLGDAVHEVGRLSDLPSVLGRVHHILAS